MSACFHNAFILQDFILLRQKGKPQTLTGLRLLFISGEYVAHLRTVGDHRVVNVAGGVGVE